MDNIIGHKILAIRKTTAAEREQMYWSANGMVLLLDNGVSLLPVTDEEANEARRNDGHCPKSSSHAENNGHSANGRS